MSAPTITPPATGPREFVRAFAAPLEIRAAGKGSDGRTVEGICVPFDQPIRIDDELVEEFASGCCDHQMRAVNRIRFKRQHWSLIGACIELRNDAAGLWGAFRVARTELGDETLALIEAGALTDLSVGFRTKSDTTVEKDGMRITRRVRVDLREVSAVEEGAYQEYATVTGTRAQMHPSGLVVVGNPLAPITEAAPAQSAEQTDGTEAREQAPEPAGAGSPEPSVEATEQTPTTVEREQATSPRLARAAALLAAMNTAAHLSSDRAA